MADFRPHPQSTLGHSHTLNWLTSSSCPWRRGKSGNFHWSQGHPRTKNTHSGGMNTSVYTFKCKNQMEIGFLKTTDRDVKRFYNVFVNRDQTQIFAVVWISELNLPSVLYLTLSVRKHSIYIDNQVLNPDPQRQQPRMMGCTAEGQTFLRQMVTHTQPALSG